MTNHIKIGSRISRRVVQGATSEWWRAIGGGGTANKWEAQSYRRVQGSKL